MDILSLLTNVGLGMGAAAVNSAVVYLSKKEPKEFEPIKFGRSIGVAAVVGGMTVLNPSLSAAGIAVVSTYGGYLIEKILLLLYRKFSDNGIVTVVTRSR